MTKVLIISTLFMKLIWAALPIKVSMFLNQYKCTAKGCKSWHWVEWSLPWSLPTSYLPFESILFLYLLAFSCPTDSIHAFEFVLSSKARRDLDERLRRLISWTNIIQALLITCRGRSREGLHCLASSVVQSMCTSSSCWWTKGQHQPVLKSNRESLSED